MNDLSMGRPMCQKKGERRFGLAVRRQAGKQEDLGSIPLRPPFSSKVDTVSCLCPSQFMKR